MICAQLQTALQMGLAPQSTDMTKKIISGSGFLVCLYWKECFFITTMQTMVVAIQTINSNIGS